MVEKNSLPHFSASELCWDKRYEVKVHPEARHGAEESSVSCVKLKQDLELEHISASSFINKTKWIHIVFQH